MISVQVRFLNPYFEFISIASFSIPLEALQLLLKSTEK